MFSFSLHQPTRLFFGADQGKAFAQAAVRGAEGVLVLGGESAERLGYAQAVRDLFAEAGATLHTFSGVEPNPQAETINKAAAFARNHNATFVVALGGGSVIDAAKGVAVLLHEGTENIWPYCWGEKLVGKVTGAAPVMAIPTTAATASEVTGFSVISNTAARGKSGIQSEHIKPAASWLNPEFTLSLGPVTTADGGADILSHVFEHYLTGGEASPLADLHSEAVMETVIRTLPKALADLTDVQHRAVLLWASNLALNGYESAGRGAGGFPMHAIEHALSAWKPDLAHGRGMATIFPAWFRWLHSQNRARPQMARLGRRLFGVTENDEAAAGLKFIEEFTLWLQENDLHQSVYDLGFKEEELPEIATYAVKVYGNGRKLDAGGAVTLDDIVTILKSTGGVKEI